MEKQIEITLFETTITKLDMFLTIGKIGIGIVGLVKFASNLFTKSGWGFDLFMCIFFILWIIQAIRGVKTFHLFPERLVVKRPFFFTTKTDKTFKTDEIKEVVFHRIKGKYGGWFLNIRAEQLRHNDDFRIHFGANIRSEFITQLNNLGVKVSSKEN